MIEVTDGTFEQDVLQAKRPVIVDFWAPWCGPCRAVAPIFDELARTQEATVVFAKVNIDDNPDYASRYGVLSIPTAILFEDGEPRETVIGARPRSYYEKAFEKWFQPPS